MAFSPDGHRLASASWDNTARLWDPTTGASCGILEGHSSWVNAVAFSPDGHRLASASDDETIRLWNPSTGVCCGILEGHTDAVTAVAFSPNGHRIAYASSGKTVRLWDPRTGACCGILEGHSGRVDAAAFSSDDHRLAYVREEWIFWRKDKILWLPVEYRPSFWAIRNNVLALGHVSGQVTFIEFDPDHLPVGKTA